MRRKSITTALLALAFGTFLLPTFALAQFKTDSSTTQAQLGDSTDLQITVGLEFGAGTRPCLNVYGTANVPMDWPEQKVRVVKEDISPGSQLTYRNLPGVRQMLVMTRSVRPGQEFKALVTYEVTRSAQLPPEDTSVYQLADSRRIPRELRIFLAPSPGIESNQSRFRAMFKEITEGKESDWEKISAIYDYVRDTIEYRDDKLSYKGAVKALADGYADCEDMTGLFIAICRAGGVPARTVWVYGHCYPEWYMVDAEGEGHWFPCQVAGTYAFGGMPDLRVILQKGDKMRTPEKPKDEQRYAAEYLRMSGGQQKWYKFVRRMESQ